jgi:hypothetical protein
MDNMENSTPTPETDSVENNSPVTSVESTPDTSDTIESAPTKGKKALFSMIPFILAGIFLLLAVASSGLFGPLGCAPSKNNARPVIATLSPNSIKSITVDKSDKYYTFRFECDYSDTYTININGASLIEITTTSGDNKTFTFVTSEYDYSYKASFKDGSYLIRVWAYSNEIDIIIKTFII